jgi:hypothetical protein
MILATGQWNRNEYNDDELYAGNRGISKIRNASWFEENRTHVLSDSLFSIFQYLSTIRTYVVWDTGSIVK